MTTSFLVEGAGPYTLAEMLTANADSPEVCEWARAAKPGDVLRDMAECQCIAAVKVCDIRRATINGRAVKMFCVRRLIDGAWVHGGTFTAPARTATRNLLQFAA